MPTFTRQERLKSRKTIGRLFNGGHAFMAYPLRVVWIEKVPSSDGKAVVATDATMNTAAHLPLGEGSGVGSIQIAVSVSKRTFKTAVQRNLLKRRIREAYRMHKHELYEKLAGRNVVFMVMYVAKEELPFAEIESGVQKMIRKFPG